MDRASVEAFDIVETQGWMLDAGCRMPDSLFSHFEALCYGPRLVLVCILKPYLQSMHTLNARGVRDPG